MKLFCTIQRQHVMVNHRQLFQLKKLSTLYEFRNVADIVRVHLQWKAQSMTSLDPLRTGSGCEEEEEEVKFSLKLTTEQLAVLTFCFTLCSEKSKSRGAEIFLWHISRDIRGGGNIDCVVAVTTTQPVWPPCFLVHNTVLCCPCPNFYFSCCSRLYWKAGRPSTNLETFISCISTDFISLSKCIVLIFQLHSLSTHCVHLWIDFVGLLDFQRYFSVWTEMQTLPHAWT